MDFEKDYLDNETSDENIEDLNKDELFDEKESELESEKEEPEEQIKGGTKSANDPEPVYFEKFDDALVSDGQGGYTNLGEAVYAKDSGGRTEINELRNLVDNTDGVVHYKGTTTTALTDGSTTNPITIDGESYTAVFGDIVVYGYTEFVFDGSAWSEFGRPFDTTPTSGSANAVTSDGIFKRTPFARSGNAGAVLGNSQVTTSGDYTVAIGRASKATNTEAFAAGYYAFATRPQSSAFGFNVQANGDASHVVGRNNRYKSGDLFEVGNGSLNSLSNIIEVDQTSLNVNGDIKKNNVSLPTPYTTMPTVTAAMLGQIAMYVGETTNDYVKGYFYIASSDGAAEPTYSWVSMVDSTPTSGSKNFVTSGAVYSRTPFVRPTGGNSAILGYGSTVSGTGTENCLVAANASTSSARNCAVIGGGSLWANHENMTVIGKANVPKAGDYFEIGNGSDFQHRSNIVEVNQTSMNINGDIQRNGVGIDDYTTTERKIGKWIDGSVLYQRTFVVTGLINANWNENVLGTSGINIVDVQGWIDWRTYGGEPEIRTSLDYYASNVDYVGLHITYNDLWIRPYRNADVGDAVITIRYTKPVVNNLSNNIQTVNEPNEEPTEGEDMRSEPVEEISR